MREVRIRSLSKSPEQTSLIVRLYQWWLSSQPRGCTREQHHFHKQNKYSLWSERRHSLMPSTRISTSQSSALLKLYIKNRRARVGNVVVRYHGTKMKCCFGSPSQRTPCSFDSCSLCSILRHSFRTSLARSDTASVKTSLCILRVPFLDCFRLIYPPNTASDLAFIPRRRLISIFLSLKPDGGQAYAKLVIRAYNYSENGAGAVIACAVALGRVYYANSFNEVKSCPKRCNSVRVCLFG